MPVVMMGIQAGIGLYNVGAGIHDRRVAKRELANLKDPIAEIPQGTLESVARTKALASNFSLPGQELLEADQNALLSSALGDVFNASSSSTDALDAITGLYGKRMKVQNDIGFNAATSYLGRNQNVINELHGLAEEQKRVWDLNVMNPYLRKMDQYYGLLTHGNNNINTGSSQVMSAVGGFSQNKAIDDMLKSMGGGNTNGADTTNQSSPNSSIMMDSPIYDYTPPQQGNLSLPE
jgi:hypothetical protein